MPVITMVLQSIQFIVAPVVMVTTCAILSGGFLSRYAAINDRLRAMARERLDLLAMVRRPAVPGPEQGAFDAIAERFEEIDSQIPTLLVHHTQSRQALFMLYGAAAIFLFDMLIIALSVVLMADLFATIALIVFVMGVALMLISLVITVQEVITSHRALHYEVRRVAALPIRDERR